MRITVLGTGYLGATHAASMAEMGFEVLGLDVDPEKVDALSRGELPFHEPGLGELLRKHVGTGRLRFTTSYEEAGAFGDVHFVGVGTPQRAGSFAADRGAFSMSSRIRSWARAWRAVSGAVTVTR